MDVTSVYWRRASNSAVTSRRSVRQGIAFFCSGKEKTAARQWLYGVRLAVKESLCSKSVYTHQFIDERLMSMRFELAGKCEAVTFVVSN